MAGCEVKFRPFLTIDIYRSLIQGIRAPDFAHSPSTAERFSGLPNKYLVTSVPRYIIISMNKVYLTACQ